MRADPGPTLIISLLLPVRTETVKLIDVEPIDGGRVRDLEGSTSEFDIRMECCRQMLDR